jgi:hypothetical protein
MRFIDGDFFESLSNFSFGDMYSPNVQRPTVEVISDVFNNHEFPTFFIETRGLPLLLSLLSKFDKDCKIICHNSDISFGEEILNIIPSNVKRIWCQNYNYLENDVIKSLPIGLERKRWVPEMKKQELLLDYMGRDIPRNKMVYMNFNPDTNPIRKKIHQELKDRPYITDEMVGWYGGGYENYLYNLKSHKYVISPPGNGIDCHRNWEALYCGCIPIVLDDYFIRNVYGDSVLKVNSFDEINEELLISERTITSISDIIDKYSFLKV